MQQSANVDQIAYWNSPAGERWAALQEQIDALFAPLTRATLEAAGVAPGERVLDVGCGCGTTTLALARQVGPGGTVLGVDVSAPMLAVAERRARAAGLADPVLADAAVHAFEPGVYDIVFSRFGVMFFDDPVAAFANLRRALKPGGRLLFACWRPMVESAWFTVPFQAALPHLPPQPASDPDAPGPFAFADPERVRAIVERAGFEGIAIEPHDTTIRMAEPGGVDAAARLAMRIGPTARLLAEADKTACDAAFDDIKAAMASHDGPGGIVLGGAIWIVAARNP